MKEEQAKSDRRKFRRYHAISGAFAVNTKFGQLVDISRGGLSFRYVERTGWPKELFEKGVIFGDDDFCLDDLPIKTICDHVVANGLSNYATAIRRCGVGFGDLSPKQRIDLEYFIWAHTGEDLDQDIS